GEVMPLRDHLRAEQHGAVGLPEAPQRSRQLLRLVDGVRVEADELKLGEPGSQLALEPLRAGPDPRQLDRAAGRALGRLRLGAALPSTATAPSSAARLAATVRAS